MHPKDEPEPRPIDTYLTRAGTVCYAAEDIHRIIADAAECAKAGFIQTAIRRLQLATKEAK